MKKAILFLLLVLAEYLHAADPKCYIMLSANNKTAASYLKYFESQFSIGLKNKLPCASYLSQSDVVAMLEWEKQKQLPGIADLVQLSNMAGAMKGEYEFYSKVRFHENADKEKAFIFKNGQDKVIDSIAKSSPGGDSSIDAVDSNSKQLTDEWQKYNSHIKGEKTWSGTITVEEHTNYKIQNKDPRGPDATVKGDLSINCVVNNNVAQCTVNYLGQVTGRDGSGTDVASGTYQTDVSISAFEGKVSISLGIIQAKAIFSTSAGGFSNSSEGVIPFGGWSVEGASGTGPQGNSTSGSVKQGNAVIAWSLTEKSSPCDSKGNQIIVVRDGNGKILTEEERKAIGLDKNSFMNGQIISVPKSIPKGIDIMFFDDSKLRISSGSKLNVGDCSPLEASFNVKLTLLLGKIWAKIAPDAELKWVIKTERSVAGNRGTIFSTEYNPTTKTTTVVVEEGSVWLRNIFGNVETIIINEGETGTQTMDHPPVLKKN